MNKNLNTKLVQIFIVFIISVMTCVGVILMNSVFNFYKNDFVQQIDEGFSESVLSELSKNLESEDFANKNKEFLTAFSGVFGFSSDRNFYILDMNGKVLASNSGKETVTIEKNRNLLAALSGKTGKKQSLGSDIMDYALYVGGESRECVIYITDNLSKMRSLTWMLFSIIIQAVLIGFVVAVILAFFLAQAITFPLSKITAGTVKIAEGNYSYRLETNSKDEIGVLTRNFNSMARVIEENLDAAQGEKEKLSKIIGCLKDGVAAFDKNGDLMFINDSAKKLLELSKNEEINFTTFTSKLDVPINTAFLKASRDIGIAEQKLHTKKANELYVDIRFTVFNYDKGETGYLVVVGDVTEKALLEKSRREFIANVSHELRTPLTSIKGATETVMLDDEMPDSMRKRFLDIVINESDRMTRIVKDLLVLSRFDNRKMTWQAAKFSFGEMVSRICTALKTSAEHKNQKLHYLDEDKDFGVMTGDKERIEQVLTNIVGNAIKYTPEGGKIGVTVENFQKKKTPKGQEETFVRVRVADNGIGIPKDDLPHLFERFYRVDKARTSDMGGTGLGLSIAKEIIEAHGGTIELLSQEGNGTTVIIELPLETGIG